MQRAAETLEQRSEKVKGERSLGTLLKLLSVSERQATSQWKSACEHGAEIPGNRSSAIRHLERGDEYVTDNFQFLHRTATHNSCFHLTLGIWILPFPCALLNVEFV